MFILVSYDISDNRRRTKVGKLLLDFGGHRVQRSVFECHIDRRQLTKLRQRLEKLIDSETDSVRFYNLCETCQDKIAYLGLAQPIDRPGLLIV